MKNVPTLKQFQYFIALAETGSFSAAAEKCFVTQSTLSAGIAALEDSLQQTLVNRAHRKVVFTPFGDDVLAQARQIVTLAEDIVIRSRELDAPLSGPLRLGMIPTIAPYLLPRILTPLQENFPALEIELHEDLTDRLIGQLHEGHIDCALLAFPYDTGTLEEKLLFSEAFYLAAPSKTCRLKGPLSYKDIADQTLLLLEDGHCLREHALEACRLEGSNIHQNLSATSLPTLIEMVRHNYGVTLLPEMAINNMAAYGDLRLIPFKKTIPGRDIGMVWRPRHPLQNDFNLLGDFIVKTYTSHLKWHK